MRYQWKTSAGPGRAALWACCIAAVQLLGACAPSPPRGVVLISIDTLRADHLGCYGYRRPTSPFLDHLAERGILFDNAIVQVPGTLPSHMSMLTGLYPAEHDVFPPDGVLSQLIPTVQEIFARHGFRTAGFTEGGYVSGHYGFARGFEVFSDEAAKLSTDIEDTFARGVEFLETLQPADRFFLFLHTYAVHDPYYPPVPYSSQYWHAIDPDTPDLTRSDFTRYGFDRIRPISAEMTESHKNTFRATVRYLRSAAPPGTILPTGPNLAAVNRGKQARPSPEALSFYEALYDASINYTDDVLRAFFGSLEGLGLGDSTVVVITSDHGEEFLEHGRLVHEQVYHECLHVPLIIVHPRFRDGRRIRGLVSSVDLAPTLYEVAAIPGPTRISGRSLMPLIQERSTTPQGEAYARAIVTPSETVYRFVEDELHQALLHRASAEGGRSELFNLARDPDGTTDLSRERDSLTRQLLAGLPTYQMVPVAPAGSAELDAEAEERLRALGYLDE